MSAPLVSILIPAYRAKWLDVAIASALAQSHRNLEILVSDDSEGDAIERTCLKWLAHGVRYMRNPNRGLLGSNRDHLISVARGDYLKFLFDDDLLLPNSVEILLQALLQSQAKLAFHHRFVVNDDGVVTDSPQCVTGSQPLELPRQVFFDQLIGQSSNAIGEPSNVLIEAAALRRLPKPFTLQQRRMGFLTDVALYTNFMATGLGIVGVPQFGSAFRIHGQQASGRSFPGFSAGLFEWEFIRRWSVDHGHLSPELFKAGHAHQMRTYQMHLPRYPELQPFIRLDGRADGPLYLSAAFLEAMDLAYASIAARDVSRKLAQTTQAQ